MYTSFRLSFSVFLFLSLLAPRLLRHASILFPRALPSTSLSLSRRPCPYLRSERSSVSLGGGVCVSLSRFLLLPSRNLRSLLPYIPREKSPPMPLSLFLAGPSSRRRSLSPSLAHSHFLSSSHASAPPSPPPSTTTTSLLRLIYSHSSTLALLPVHTSDRTNVPVVIQRVYTFTRVAKRARAPARSFARVHEPMNARRAKVSHVPL